VNRVHRREAVKALLRERGDLLVVAGLGASAYDVAAAGERPVDFPLWGAMGGAAMVGLGLALAQPERPVLVLTGDGEMLMGLGSLATIAAVLPDNLHLVVLDNEAYAETGGQPTLTAGGFDLAAVARACGFPRTGVLADLDGVEGLRAGIHSGQGLSFTVIKVFLEELPRVLPPRDGAALTRRFREALLGPDAAARG